MKMLQIKKIVLQELLNHSNSVVIEAMKAFLDYYYLSNWLEQKWGEYAATTAAAWLFQVTSKISP